MNNADTPARTGERPTPAKPPRGIEAIASVQSTMKTALEQPKRRKDTALEIAAKWRRANANLPPLDRDVSSAVADRQWAKFDAAVTRLYEIECRVAKAEPTTIAGAIAMLRVAIDANREDLNPPVLGVLERVAEFLERRGRL